MPSLMFINAMIENLQLNIKFCAFFIVVVGLHDGDLHTVGLGEGS